MKDVFPKGVAWINNEFVDISEAKIPILDWGFLRSDATYDVVHVWKNRFFLLDKHIDRFFNSTKKLKMPCSMSREEIKSILAGCVKKSKLESSYVEMIQTRGMSPTFDRDPRKAVPRFMAFAVPFGWILKHENFEKGLDVAITNIKRIPPTSIDPLVKNYHWLDFVGGMYQAYELGCQTGVLIDQENNILEGPGFNIFSFDGRSLYTPGKGILEGVTRSAVIKIAKEKNIDVFIAPISQDKFRCSKEVFITSTAGGVMPVTKINGRCIGDGMFGSFTRNIYNDYWKKHLDPKWSCSVESLLK